MMINYDGNNITWLVLVNRVFVFTRRVLCYLYYLFLFIKNTGKSPNL